VPHADRDQFRAWSEAVGDVRHRARSEHGLRELSGYGRQLAVQQRKQPGDDVISRLCADGLGDDEIRRYRRTCCLQAMRQRWWRSAWASCAC